MVSSRCKNMWASARVINGALPAIGLTTETGARLRAWNNEATAMPWNIPARQQSTTYLGGTRRMLFATPRWVNANNIPPPKISAKAEVTNGGASSVTTCLLITSRLAKAAALPNART